MCACRMIAKANTRKLAHICVGPPVRAISVNHPTQRPRGHNRDSRRHRLNPPRQPDRTPNVCDFRRSTVPKRRAILDVIAVHGPTAQPKVQRTRERRFDDARIGARMPRGIARPDPNRTPGPSRTCRDGDPCDPSRNQVHQIIEARAGPPEAAVARCPIADHRVECVNRSIHHRARRAENRRPHKRSDRRVRRIFGNRFDGRAGDTRGVELIRISSTETGHQCSGGINVVTFECVGHLIADPTQRRTAEGRVHRETDPDSSQSRRPDADGCCSRDAQTRERHPRHSRVDVHSTLQRTRYLAHARHRMTPSGVTEDTISEIAECNPRGDCPDVTTVAAHRADGSGPETGPTRPVG